MKTINRIVVQVISIFILSFSLSCSNESDLIGIVDQSELIDGTDGSAQYSVLFIGNSLTYSNNVPQLVQAIGLERDVTISVESQTFGGFGLEDHWNQGNIQGLINTNNYDFVVIQQGPSSQAYGRESLIEYGGLIADLCFANGSQLVFYMVWPSLTYYHTFGGVIANYTEAAMLSGARLAPVGSVWKQHFDSTNDFSYYGPDGFHPSQEGSQVAAEVIYNTLGI